MRKIECLAVSALLALALSFLMTPSAAVTPVDLGSAANDTISSTAVKDIREGENVTVDGIEFRIAHGTNCIHAGKDSEGRFPIPIGRRAEALYVLAHALWVSDTGKGMSEFGLYEWPEALRLRLEYADGSIEENSPLHLGQKRFMLEWGKIAAYYLPLRQEVLDKVVIIKESPYCDVTVLGLTLGDEPPQGIDLAKLRVYEKLTCPVPGASARSLRRTRPGIVSEQGRVTIQNSYYTAVLKTTPRLYLESISWTRSDGTRLSSGPLSGKIFLVNRGGKLFPSTDFASSGMHVEPQVKNAGGTRPSGKKLILELRSENTELPLDGTLSLTVDATPDLGIQLSLKNRSDNTLEAALSFPVLEHIDLGKEAAYYYPMYEGLLSSEPLAYNHYYGGVIHLQVMDVFSRDGGGLYLRVNDTTARYKTFQFVKSDSSGNVPGHNWVDTVTQLSQKPYCFSMAVNYFMRTVPPDGVLDCPEAVVGFHDGDWKVALDRYRDWMNGWYKEPERPAWIYPVGTMMRIWAQQSWDRAFNAPRLFGDFDFYDAQGGNFGQVRGRGLPVGTYTEAAAVGGPVDMEKATIHKNGQPGSPYPWGYFVCPLSEKWQKEYPRSLADTIRGSQLDGIYCDELGRVNVQCYSKNHKHTVPDCYPAGTLELARLCREAVKSVSPDKMMWTEGPGMDLMVQYLDACYAYEAQASGVPDTRPFVKTGCHIFRFMFPKLKEILLYCLGANAMQQKRGLFNGTICENTGHMIITNPDGPGISKIYPYLNRTLGRTVPIHRENWDAFYSHDILPLVDLGQKNTYANRFDAPGKTVLTLYNPEYWTIQDTFHIERRKEFHLVDLTNEEEVELKDTGKQAAFERNIFAKDVLALAYLPRLITVEAGPESITVSVPKRLALVRTEITLKWKSRFTTKCFPAETTSVSIPLPELPEKSTGVLIVKLLLDGKLADWASCKTE